MRQSDPGDPHRGELIGFSLDHKAAGPVARTFADWNEWERKAYRLCVKSLLDQRNAAPATDKPRALPGDR